MDDGGGDVSQSLLTAGEMANPLAQKGHEAEVVGDAGDALPQRRPSQAGQTAEELEVLDQSERRIEADGLRSEPDEAIREPRTGRHLHPSHGHPTPIGAEEPRHDREQGRLASTVPPQKRNDLTRADGEVDTGQRPCRTVVLLETAHLENRSFACECVHPPNSFRRPR